MKRLTLTLIMLCACYWLAAQHIEYRHKLEPKPTPPVKTPIKDTSTKNYGNNLFGVGPSNLCPALPASLPVRMNYVDSAIVVKMKRMYDDHVYSITKLLTQEYKVEYKLTICYKGQMRTDWVDPNGTHIRQKIEGTVIR